MRPMSPRPALLPLYAATLFLSAGLLFLVEPMFAKMVLPKLGGTPAVWTTCMVFFQAVLLAGYLYAHVATKLLAPRKLLAVHLGVLALAFLVLPLTVSDAWKPRADGNPVGSLLAILALTVGLPFFAVSTSGPLLQKWFAGTGHPAAKDPYFLYGASNLGSMLGLLAYPFVLEPLAELGAQSWIWTGGYTLLVALTAACGALAASGPAATPETAPTSAPALEAAAPDETLTWGRMLRWIALAAVPSSLMLGVTTHITSEIGAIPLLWVIPLALYIGSFIVVFARRQVFSMPLLARVLAFLVIGVVVSQAIYRVSRWWDLPLHVATFFVFSLVLHGALAKDRPSTRHLTIFYVLMSLGGVVGGLFNGIVAPGVFTGVSEYPIAIVAGCLLVPAAAAGRWWLDLLLPLGLFAVLQGAFWYANNHAVSYIAGMIAVVMAPAVACFAFSRRPVRFGLGIAALLITHAPSSSGLLHAERSFFAIHRVVRGDGERLSFNSLFHGTTMHGKQRIDPKTGAPIDGVTPLTYYTRRGPVGQYFASRPAWRNIAIVGLGSGLAAAYAEKGQTVTFYEIDPIVKEIAEDTRFFSYLFDARQRGADVKVVLGDARLTIHGAAPASLDLLLLDAFSSDNVPAHLLTREALRLYLEKLAPGGLIALNISNRYLNLRPVLTALTADAGLVIRNQDDDPAPEEEALGAADSSWVVMARSEADLGAMRDDPRWKRLPPRPDVKPWTDGYSNILSVLGARDKE